MLDRPTDNMNADPEPKAATYAFPSKSRCPVCGSLDTERTANKAGVQYRRCSGCEATYKVIGMVV